MPTKTTTTPAKKAAAKAEPAAPKAPKFAVHPDHIDKPEQTACDEFGRSFEPGVAH